MKRLAGVLNGGIGAWSTLSAIAALLLYITTLAPTFGWGDSADLALRSTPADDLEFVGRKREYFLYRAVVSIFQVLPLGDAGTRANLATAVFGAVTIGLVAYLVGILTGSRFGAACAGLTLAVSHSFWFLSVTAEVYTFNLMLIVAFFVALARWLQSALGLWLVAAAVAAGLALTHHPSGLVLAAAGTPILLLARSKVTVRDGLASVVAWLAASSHYWKGVARRLQDSPLNLSALGLEPPRNTFVDAEPVKEAFRFLGHAGYNFPGLAAILAIVGLHHVVRQRRVDALAPMLWGTLLIGAGIASTIPDKFNIYVVAYPSLAVATGVGVTRLSAIRTYGPRGKVLLLGLLLITPLACYGATTWASHRFKLNLAGARVAPYRDNATYFLWPPKNGDYGPRRYADEALSALVPNAMLIADYTLWRPLMFMQRIEAMRPDVEIVFVERILREGVANVIAQNIDARSVYLATNKPPSYYQLREVEKTFALERNGVVYRVVRKPPGKANAD